MTAEEILHKYYYGRNNQSTDPATNILNAMKAFAQDMCEKQKEICALDAERLWIANTYCQIDQMCDKIIYSPLPEELQ